MTRSTKTGNTWRWCLIDCSSSFSHWRVLSVPYSSCFKRQHCTMTENPSICSIVQQT
ncbi:hypothetical protein OESDEN_19302 [Oesophagostomum dentatum]|uniref:Uncharacterized protein n=1 Tax=Oesophagostomum dentatum TaxID=61180 RepID=A0A0B1SAU7_OESDE|nr:hypothetical protein OESDEN_19302 [Oesophagostomum dentatum]